jgi:hypothetical protein
MMDDMTDDDVTAQLRELLGAGEFDRLQRDIAHNQQLRELAEKTEAAWRAAVAARHRRLRQLVDDGWPIPRAAEALGLSRQAAAQVLR